MNITLDLPIKSIKLCIEVEFFSSMPTEPDISSILRRLDIMSEQLDQLTVQVTETNTVIDSAIVLIRGIKEKLDAAGSDPAKLAELSAALDSKETELAEAITANTPVEPTP